MRKIIHLDLDAFFCAVEELRDPTLAGQPFAVGGRPEDRGVVSSCSYAARQLGIHSAMPMARALHICPSLRIISSHYHNYSEYSQRVMALMHELTPLVEQISIDEAFMDISDLPDDPEILARRLQAAIHKELGLPCSLGIATNKLLAKIATNVGKASNRSSAPPNAITTVPPGQEANFLAPLPVEALWGVGPKTAARLTELGMRTIGDLANYSTKELVRFFGKNGIEMSRHAQGLDDRPIFTSHEVKSISQEITFARDITDVAQLRHTLSSLSDKVGRRLREIHRCGTTVRLKLRWPDFTTITRQVSLLQPTDQDNIISAAAIQLFDKVWQKGKAVRLIGVGVSGLRSPVRQLNLWDDTSQSNSTKNRQLQVALDTLRERFGRQIIQRASDLKVDND